MGDAVVVAYLLFVVILPICLSVSLSVSYSFAFHVSMYFGVSVFEYRISIAGNYNLEP